METHLTFDNRSKQLGVLFKQRITTNENLQLKVLGVLNTLSGHVEYCAKLRKYFGLPKSCPRTAALPKEYLLSVRGGAQVLPSDRALVGLGLTYLSHSDDILAGMVAQKQTFIGSAESPVTLKLKAQADFHAQTSQMDGVGRIQFSKSWYNFTDMQDIRAVVGCKAHVNHKGQINLVCFQMPDCNHKQTGRCPMPESKKIIGLFSSISEGTVELVMTYERYPPYLGAVPNAS